MWRATGSIRTIPWPSHLRRRLSESSRRSNHNSSQHVSDRAQCLGIRCLSLTFQTRVHSGGGRRGYSRGSSSMVGTQLGAYLQQCGATWDAAPKVHAVMASDDNRTFWWKVDLPVEHLQRIQRGDPLESPPFSLGSRHRARFQFYPRGDNDCSVGGMSSLWLWTDSRKPLRTRLRVGSTEREGGASEFCELQHALQDGQLQVALSLDGEPSMEEERGDGAEHDERESVQQSLQITGLQMAEWQVFGMQQVLESDQFVTSAPFRFHHVLLGDMYLELRPNVPYNGHCTVFFQCRVPTMKLLVTITVGDTFSKSFESQGRSTHEADLASGNCLGVNLSAPGVLRPDGSLAVRCSLEEVVNIPANLRNLIPKLDERAQWPKRL
mmetsp:Transcript_207/g.456  ORF Transcript_207/g.456 Transcript_207/m.456 type:complete len:380 (+) Transcript_207:66-1205(+)